MNKYPYIFIAVILVSLITIVFIPRERADTGMEAAQASLGKICKGVPKTFTLRQGAFKWDWEFTVSCTKPDHRPPNAAALTDEP